MRAFNGRAAKSFQHTHIYLNRAASRPAPIASASSQNQPVEVTAADVLGATATVSGPPATVAARVAARGTWLDHLREGRLRTYASPCPSIGFGTCDAAFAAIHGAHGFADFELFRAAASEDWFVDPGNIP